ncbi:MAG: Smr/MutS family protein [Deltaproteobacteria bacterium]|nr:Smr/MutS family protein [Deltaproteobacteria bacterium]
MAGVDRFDRERGAGRVPLAPGPLVGRRPNEDAEAFAELMDLVDGQVAFDISDTEEFVEGIAKGLDRRLLRRLKRGEYSVQAHLDLHGMVRDEAKGKVRSFLLKARGDGLRCVLVVSGRGKHSEGKDPVLKRELVGWLTHKILGRYVLAFCSARPYDGGAGAVYVLLRRQGSKG